MGSPRPTVAIVTDTVTYALRDNVATISLDDGKANALSFELIGAIHTHLDQAASDGAGAVLIAGRPGMFSGGFDLAVMRSGDAAATGKLVTEGAELILRLYSSAVPVVAACTGHAVAAGAFMLMGAHHRIGAEGEFRIVLIETQIGMVLPDWAVELTMHRLAPPHAERAAVEAFVYDPSTAVAAGFLDRVVPAADAVDAAFAEAVRLASLPARAYAGNAAKVRAAGIDRVKAALDRDRRGLLPG